MIYKKFEEFISTLTDKKVFLVCGNSFDAMPFADSVKKMDIVRFGDFTPNHPNSGEIARGVEAFSGSGCDCILAVGGGSAVDTAKCIKLYSKSRCELTAVPTTAGTGSENTRFAVMYIDNVKQSITDDSILPDNVVYVPETLATLSPYMKKASLLDAVCHAVESSWSKRATDESREYSAEALDLILPNVSRFLENDSGVYEKMLAGAGLAGKAINITTTTAAHAMCYKLSEIYSLQHGHAAGLCLSAVWPYLAEKNTSEGLSSWLEQLELIFEKYYPGGKTGPGSGYMEFLGALGFENPVFRKEDTEVLAESVNPERLGNFPVAITKDEIKELYMNIFRNSGSRVEE